MPNCSNCSAPLPANSVICTYCGSRNNVDLAAVHYYTTHDSDTVRICPVCSKPLKTIDLGVNGTFFIERCDECLGLFFDPGELEALLEHSVTNVFEINRSRLARLNEAAPASGRVATYIKCPVCATIMNRISFGARSGVVVDRCKEHGVWLDAGELRQLYEWTKAGGKLLDKEREEQKKSEQLLDAKMRRNRATGGVTADGISRDPFDFTVNAEPSLFDILANTVRFLTKL